MSNASFDFANGDCALFAVALNKSTGLPIRALVEYSEELQATVLVHAYGWMDESPYPALDVTGATTVADILSRYPTWGAAEDVPMTEDEAMSLNYGDVANWPDWRDALPAVYETLKAMKDSRQHDTE